MKKSFTILILFFTLLSNAQDKIALPFVVQSNFDKEFKDVLDLSWSIFYRGKNNNDLRFEAEFLKGNSKYLVSYSEDGAIKAIEKSISVNSLNENITSYLIDNYPSFELNQASFIVKEEDKVFYNVAISDDTNYFILVFNEKGTFMYLTTLMERM
ncbi:hypothetical protein [Flavobacterium sp.]|uniref:hypothetical protein n=1 Tax=Flavobacterium sp. TaxID=239 RepID=UPI003F69AAEC